MSDLPEDPDLDAVEAKRVTGRPLTALAPLGPVQRGSEKTPTEVRRHRKDTGLAYTEAAGDQVLQALYESRGSLLTACRRLGLAYLTVQRWLRTEPSLREGRDLVDTFLLDDAHRLFMGKVLADKAPPAFPIFFMKSRDPRYAEKGKGGGITVNVAVTDGTLTRPVRAIDATVTKALTAGE